jgi:hypothetical protein
MISGIEFQKICRWNICNRYPIKFEPHSISEVDFIFVNTDNIVQFTQVLKNNNLPKVNLILHNSDLSFNSVMFEGLKNYVKHIYSINCIIENEIITKIPLGFSDRLITIISRINPIEKKTNLLYMNFNIHSGRIKERVDCRNYFSQFDWITFEDLVPEEQYYNTLNNSKYSVCPIGAGLDTHRFYESIYFNTIPIVKRNQISDLHSKFPCIIINDWNEINKNYLETNYDRYQNLMMDWKKNNDWLNPSFWLK